VINVYNFNLLQGQWFQVTPTATLPNFTVANNFQINSGTLPAASAQFVRALSGDGTTSGTAYLLTDIYGVQGIGSSTTMLGQFFNLNNNINASTTSNWNSGTGFLPIGNANASNAFSGSMNGQQFVISNLYLNNAGTNVGLFGYVTAGAPTTTIISNLGLANAFVSGSTAVGALVGTLNQGTLSNSYSTGSVTATGAGVIPGREA